MAYRSSLVFLITLTVVLTGCRRDKQVHEVLDEARSFTASFVHEVLVDSSFATGIKKGNTFLDENGESMRKKWKGMEDYNQVQVKSETLEELEKFVVYSRREIARIRMHFAEDVEASHKNEEALNHLVDRYYEVLDH